MADATKRVNYFDRQFLRAGEFQDEQGYELDRRRRHNRLLHSPGIGEGLQATGNAGDTSVQVSPGTAYDGLGREIVLAAAQTVSVSAITGGIAYITVSYGEQSSDPSTDPGVTGTATRIWEVPILAASNAEPGTSNLNLLLATVALNGSGVLTAPPNNAVRTTAGALIPSDLILHSVTFDNTSVPPAQWPKFVCPAANAAGLQNASLDLDAGREVYFQDNGQVRSFDDNHKLVFNRANNLMELHEFGDIVFMTGGAPPTEKMRVTGGGALGVGTPTPDRPLTVQAQRTGQELVSFKDPTGATKWHINQNLGGNTPGLNFSETGVADGRLFIQAGGNIGIGTTSPTGLLSVKGPNVNQGTITFFNSALSADIEYDGGADKTFLIHADNNAVTGFTGGNIGIGTITPAAAFDVASGIIHVAGSTNPPTPVQGAYLGWNALTGGTGETDFINNQGLGTGGFAFMNTPNAGTPRTTLMVISGAGHLGVGTTTPRSMVEIQAPGASVLGPVLTITNSSGGQGAACAVDFNTFPPQAAGTYNPSFRIQAIDDGNFLNDLVFSSNKGGGANATLAERIRVGSATNANALDVSGAAHATAFPTSSDARFKTNVKPLGSVLKKLDKIRGVSFEWNEKYKAMGRSTNRPEIGVIAQEIEPQFPELVSTWGEGHKAVDYGRLTAVLLEAIKELKAQNADLLSRVEKCEKKLGASSGKKAATSAGGADPKAASGD